MKGYHNILHKHYKLHPLPYHQKFGINQLVSYMLFLFDSIDLIDHFLFHMVPTYIIHKTMDILYHNNKNVSGSDLIYLFCHYNRKDLLKSYEYFFNDREVLELYYEDSIYKSFTFFKTAFHMMEKRMGTNVTNNKNNYIKRICNMVYWTYFTNKNKNKILKWLLKQFDFDDTYNDTTQDMIKHDQAYIVSWCIRKGFIRQNDFQRLTNKAVQRCAKNVVELMVSKHGITVDKKIVRQCKDTEMRQWMYAHGAVDIRPVGTEWHMIVLILLIFVLFYFIAKKK